MKFSFWGYLKLLVKRKNFKLTDPEKLYVQGEDQILQEMDIINLTKKLQDVEKLKRILLTEKQLYFFELLSKPTISLNENISYKKKEEFFELMNKNKNGIEQSMQGRNLKYENFIALYNELKSNKQIGFTDKKILDLLDYDIIKVFSENS